MATRKTAREGAPVAPPPAAVRKVPAAKKPAFKLPKSLAACADLLYEKRAERLAIQKQVDALEAEEKLIKEHLINSLPKGEASGIAGKVARVAVVTKDIAQVTDWDKLYAHIKRTGSFDLLGRSLTKAAVDERWAAKKEIPGVGHFNAVSVSVTKV